MICAVIGLTFWSLISLCSSNYIPLGKTPLWNGATGFCLALPDPNSNYGKQVQLDDCNLYAYTVLEAHLFNWVFIPDGNRFMITSSQLDPTGTLCLMPPSMSRVLDPLIVADCGSE